MSTSEGSFCGFVLFIKNEPKEEEEEEEEEEKKKK